MQFDSKVLKATSISPAAAHTSCARPSGAAAALRCLPHTALKQRTCTRAYQNLCTHWNAHRPSHRRPSASSDEGAGAPLAADPSLVPKRVAVFVEPSPFTYVCGYKNRFCTMIKFLVEAGCEVLVVTTGGGRNRRQLAAHIFVFVWLLHLAF